MTLPKMKRLSSFPDAYKTLGDLATIWMRLGNSVPPLFMKAIAEHIKLNILENAKGNTQN